MRLCIDIDGVVAMEGEESVYGSDAGWCYEKCVPVPGAAEALQQLKKAGHKITFFSSRWLANYVKTGAWLVQHEIPFDSLILGRKPSSDLYIDDRGYRFQNWEDTLKFIEGVENSESVCPCDGIELFRTDILYAGEGNLPLVSIRCGYCGRELPFRVGGELL